LGETAFRRSSSKSILSIHARDTVTSGLDGRMARRAPLEEQGLSSERTWNTCSFKMILGSSKLGQFTLILPRPSAVIVIVAPSAFKSVSICMPKTLKGLVA
jgi:hypothetical protein